MSGTPTRLRVTIRAPDDAPAPQGQLRVSVEDVRRADAPAPQLAAETFPLAATGERVLGPFELTALLPPGGDYSVRVHVDRSGDGTIAPGDLVSVAKHSLPAEPNAELEVDVHPVAGA
jgi:putative lipoprotein